MGFIYALCTPSTGEIRYVGQTARSVEKRVAAHLGDTKKGGSLPVHRWLRKLNAPPLVRVLEEVTDDNLNAAEVHWIATLRQSGARLLNLTAGGDGIAAGTKIQDTSKYKARWTKEERAKQSERLRAAYRDDPSLREQRRAEANTPEALQRSRDAARKRWAA